MRCYFLILSVLCSLLSAEEPLGPLCDLQGLHFRGGEPFTDEKLRAALLSDPETLMELHPRTARTRASLVIRQGLERGYQSCGFPDVVVSVGRWDDDGTTVVITPGPRYHCGELRILGSDDADLREHIRQALLLPHRSQSGEAVTGNETAPTSVEDEPACWPVETGPPFHRDGLAAIERQLARSLRREGLYDVRLVLDLERDETARLAHLRVRVTDAGRRLRIADIRVEGAKRNRPEPVLALTGLTVGEPLSGRRLSQARDALVHSGSFLAATVIQDAEQPGAVIVTVHEHATLPLLGEERDPVLALVQGAINQIEPALNSGRWDIDIRYDHAIHGRIRLVYAPGRGLCLSAPLLGGGRLELLADGGSYRLRVGNRPPIRVKHSLRTTLQIDAHGNPGASENEPPSAMTMSLKMVTDQGGGFELQAVVQPAVVNGTTFAGATRIEEDGATLITMPETGDEADGLKPQEARIRIGADGRFQHWQGVYADAVLSLGMGQGLFEEAHDAWGEDAETVPGIVLMSACLDGLLRLGIVRDALATHQGDTKSDIEAALTVASKLLREAMGVLESTLPEADQAEPSSQFSIPVTESPADGSVTALFAKGLAVVHVLSLRWAPFDHWLPTVSREATRLLHGRHDHVGAELRRLFNDPALGPVGCSAVAWLLELIGKQPPAAVFRDRALERSDPSHFHREMAPFIDRLGEALMPLLRIIAEAESLEDLARLDPDPARRLAWQEDLRQQQARARDLLGQPQASAEAVAEILWHGSVKSLLERLR